MGSEQSKLKELENIKTMSLNSLKKKINKFPEWFVCNLNWDKHSLESVAIAQIVVATGKPEQINMVLSQPNADFNIETRNGYSLPHFAVMFNNTDGLLEIFKYPTNINAKEKIKGQTPLHVACSNRNFRAVKILLENRANVNIKDKNGKKPIDLASDEIKEEMESFQKKEKRDIKVVEMIEDYEKISSLRDMQSRIEQLEVAMSKKAELQINPMLSLDSRRLTLTSLDSGYRETEFGSRQG